MRRVQSPSSINTYNQCPRKYYFIYYLKMPTSPSIHLIRGSVAHLVLENIFDIDPKTIISEYDSNIQIYALKLLQKYWHEAKEELAKLSLPEAQLEQYYRETQYMIINWTANFNHKLRHLMREAKSYEEAFNILKPETEVEYISTNYNVKGYIDAIEKVRDQIRLMDYKTSKSAHINDAYRLQLAIYALLYEEKHNMRPDKVGIYFLKEQEQLLDVDSELINHAKFHIENIHAATESNDIDDYPKKISPLCKWSAGQCDFYEYCYQGKAVPREPLKKDIDEKMQNL